MSSKSKGSFGEIRKYLELAGKKYHSKHGKIPVLILDNCNDLLSVDGSGIKELVELERFAKDQADDISKLGIRIIFVSSEGSVPAIFQCNLYFPKSVSHLIF